MAVLTALQLVDDHLDFVGSSASLGQPALSDMDQGLATAPVLFALEEFPQIGDIVKRSPPRQPRRNALIATAP
jgi:geranyl diphosphate synthase